jgi:hypothetical protein
MKDILPASLPINQQVYTICQNSLLRRLSLPFPAGLIFTLWALTQLKLRTVGGHGEDPASTSHLSCNLVMSRKSTNLWSLWGIYPEDLKAGTCTHFTATLSLISKASGPRVHLSVRQWIHKM